MYVIAAHISSSTKSPHFVSGISKIHQMVQFAGHQRDALIFRTVAQAEKFAAKYRDTGYGLPTSVEIKEVS